MFGGPRRAPVVQYESRHFDLHAKPKNSWQVTCRLDVNSDVY